MGRRLHHRVGASHTFELTYHVAGAVEVAPDVGILNWEFVSTKVGRLGPVDVDVTLPGSGTDTTRLRPHGILEGNRTLAGNRITIHVDDRPAGTQVELRTTQPASDFTVPPSGSPRLQEVLAQEKQFAQTANDERDRLKSELRDKDRKRLAGNIGGPIMAALGAVGFWLVWRRWGKEPPHPDDISEYWRDIPTDTPAVCQTVLAFGSVPTSTFGSTLVDLAQRGWLTITEEKDNSDYLFTRSAQVGGPLTEYESALLWRLFPAGGAVRQSDVLAQARADSQAAASWLGSFKKGIGVTTNRKGYVDKGHTTKWLYHALIVLGVGGLGFVFGAAFEAPLGWVAVAVAVVLLLLSPILRQRTAAGARAIAQVEGLKHFLKDFSRLGDESHAGDLILYERYLVYAVALGVAKDLIAGLKVRFPQMADPGSGFALWYVAGSFDGGIGRLDSVGTIGDFANDFASESAAAFSPPSSDSGTDGFSGFSIGDSGGGGGGDIGGW